MSTFAEHILSMSTYIGKCLHYYNICKKLQTFGKLTVECQPTPVMVIHRPAFATMRSVLRIVNTI